MALVLWDPVVALNQLVLWRDFVLLVDGDQLAPYVHSAPGRRLLARPGRNVSVLRGSMTLRQIGTHRPSYINAILIQSRGLAVEQPCETCRRSRTGPHPFPECRRAVGHFGGACANCKWRDHANRCSVRSGTDEDDDVVYLGSLTLEDSSRINDARALLDSDHDGDSGSSADHPLLLE